MEFLLDYLQRKFLDKKNNYLVVQQKHQTSLYTYCTYHIYQGKKHPYLQQHNASIDLIVLYSHNRNTRCLPYDNTKIIKGLCFPSQLNLSHSDLVPVQRESWQQISNRFPILF